MINVLNANVKANTTSVNWYLNFYPIWIKSLKVYSLLQQNFALLVSLPIIMNNIMNF